jgi:hypothetical protein
MQGTNLATLFGHGIHPFRVGVAPLVARSLSSNGRIEGGRLEHDASLQQALRDILAVWDGRVRASSPARTFKENDRGCRSEALDSPLNAMLGESVPIWYS